MKMIITSMSKCNLGHMALLLILMFSSCSRYESEYDGLEIKQSIFSPVDFTIVDTLVIDASSTSQRGIWLVHDKYLFFADRSVVGLMEFDSSGRFLGKHLKQGRGPGETISPFIAICFDDNGHFIGASANWRYYVFDKDYSKELASYVFLSDENYKYDSWVKLLQKPDPEKNAMYEYNHDSNSMVSIGQDVVIPIWTEHVTFNAFIKPNSRRYWRQAYNFMRINPYDGRIVAKFGHFPPAYQQRPRMNSFLDFFVDYSDEKLFTSYPVDSLIYVRDKYGELLYAFGRGVQGFDYLYPQNSSFDEYTANYREQRNRCGFFQEIKSIEGFVFRSYKCPGKNGYGIQVYNGNSYAGEMHFNEKTRVIGKIDNYFYAVTDADVENDVYYVYRFTK